MGQTAFYAPAHRVLGKMAAVGAIPKDAAPPLDFLTSGLQDHRLPWNRKTGGLAAIGYFGSGAVLAVNQAPAALGTAKIAALANVSSGVAMTLAGASTGITVISSATLLLPSAVSISSGLVIDGLPARKNFGENFVVGYYDRTTMLGRAVSVTGVSGGTGGDFIVSGYDVYGYAMTEKITVGAGVATGSGKKAFKIVTSVVPQFTDAHNYSVGTLDVFGLPLRADSFAETLIHWNDGLITANTGFTAAVTTSPATNVTGDVRGTYAVQSASDGTKKLVVRINASLTAVQANPTVGLFGVTQA